MSNEHRSWVTNAQTKGVANPNSIIQRKTVKIDIKYDIIRTNKLAHRNKHTTFDIKHLRENATQLQRDPIGRNKIQKLIQTRNIYHKINQKLPNTPDREQIIEKENVAWINKTWFEHDDIIRRMQISEFPLTGKRQKDAYARNLPW